MKGYKLYDIQIKQILISRDVVFHKEVFLFHSITSQNWWWILFPKLFSLSQHLIFHLHHLLPQQLRFPLHPNPHRPFKNPLFIDLPRPQKLLHILEIFIVILNHQPISFSPRSKHLYQLPHYLSYKSFSLPYETFICQCYQILNHNFITKLFLTNIGGMPCKMNWLLWNSIIHG